MQKYVFLPLGNRMRFGTQLGFPIVQMVLAWGAALAPASSAQSDPILVALLKLSAGPTLKTNHQNHDRL